MARRARIALVAGALAIACPHGAAAADAKIVAQLSGGNEPFPGDPKGTAVFGASIDVDTGELCYSLKGNGLGPLITAHVSAGILGTEGPPLVTIDIADNECRAVDPVVLGRIVAAPSSFYINVHTADYPRGAVRGQLEPAR